MREAKADSSRLADLDHRLRTEFDRFRASGSEPADMFRGLYIDESDVDGLLGAQPSQSGSVVDEERLRWTQSTFGLEDFEMAVFLAAAAPEIEPSYERIFAFLQDDITKKRPTVGLLLRLLCASQAEAADRRRTFHPTAPLFTTGLVNLGDSQTGADTSLLNTPLRVDERIVGFLLGLDLIDQRLLAYTEYDPAPKPSRISTRISDRVTTAARAGDLLVLNGQPSIGKRQAAILYAQTRAIGLLTVDVAGLIRSQASSPSQAVRLVFREAMLLSAAVYFAAANSFWADDDKTAAAERTLETLLQSSTVACVMGGPNAWEAPPVLGGRPTVRTRVPMPGAGERRVIWQEELEGQGVNSADLEQQVASNAASFRLSAGQIRQAVQVAGVLAELDRDPASQPRHLVAGARAVSSRQLATLAQEVIPKAGWDHLILPDDSVAQLREVCSAVRNGARVMEEWGFERRLTGGRGVTALFAGVSGTGKTMGAEVIAGELGLAMFRINLATTVSKWIGETEKNLDRIFEAAWDSNAILFFDEADALFGKRSEVKDSHDRYANLEISYLLQKMEAYEGVAILATNMRHQIDDAFLRRITFHVIFPFPEEVERARIWTAVWPPELPRDPDVDFARLAHVKLAGGNIKNVVMSAAHLAAAVNRSVRMSDLTHAIRREHQKVGKHLAPGEVVSLLGPPS